MHWKQLAQMSESELAAQDLGLIHHFCALGLPGTETTYLEAETRKLDQIAWRVRKATDKTESRFEQNPEVFKNSRAFFQMLILTTVLQRDLGFRSTDKLNGDNPDWSDSRDLFVHGLLRGLPGTCSNLPVLYAAVGRRLNYPLRLVCSPHHVFLRWDDPSGERFNVECTELGFASHPDDYYLTWPTNTPRQSIEGTYFLKSLTPREELSGFLIQRAACLDANGRHVEAVDACAWGYRLAPDHRLHRNTLIRLLTQWEMVLWERLPPPLPTLTITNPHGPESVLPRTITEKMIHLQVLDDLSKDSILRAAYQRPVRRSQTTGLPYGLPAHLHVNYCDQSACEWNERKQLRRL